MRLVTRSDFDGLACGALLKEIGLIDSWKFAHPKDLQDGLVEITENDVLANVPFVEGCGLWFDHHSSEHERNQLAGKYKGESRNGKKAKNNIIQYQRKAVNQLSDPDRFNRGSGYYFLPEGGRDHCRKL